MRLRSLLLAPSLVALAVIAAACSDSSDDAPPSTTSSSTTSSSTTSSSTTSSSTTIDAETPVEGSATLERYVGAESEIYADLANWVCHPGSDDICDEGLDATRVDADGTLTVEPWSADPDAPIDCFYVYPTISRDDAEISDRVASDEEEGYAALNQVARLGEVCRVFAPVYRQRTLAGLAGALSGATTTTVAGEPADPAPGFSDVLEAWRHYMATENDGRGVVLIGHSQGSSVLNQLMREEIDPNDDVIDVLVSAYLAGSSVRVPEGQDVGGDFANVPLCRAEDQTGCVLSWAAFRSDAPPPPNALFGRPRSGDGVAACNQPAALAGGATELDAYFPAAAGASILTSLGTETEGRTWVDPSVGEITTPFVTLPGLLRGECVSRDGFNYLEVTVQADPNDPRADDISGDLTPQWGLHLVDVSLVMGDIVDLVRTQRDAFSGRD